MIKKTFLLCLFLISLSSTYAQMEFHWGAGLGAYSVDGNWVPGIAIEPRVNLLDLSESASFGIGTSIGIGYLSTGSGLYNDSEDRLGYDIPLMFMFNMGRAASSISTEQVGAFVGIGYGFSTMNFSGSYMEEVDMETRTVNYEIDKTASGPILMAGLRFQAGSETLGVNVAKIFGQGGEGLEDNTDPADPLNVKQSIKGLDGLSVRVIYYFGDY